MERRITGLIVQVAAAALFLTACGKKTENEAEVLAVDVARPVVDSVMLYKSYPGTLTADSKVDLVARVNGYIVSKDYVSGDYVHKGKVLFRIEDTNYRDAVREAEAVLATALGNLEYASSHYAAMEEAIRSDAVSGMEVSQAKSALTQARASVKEAEASLQTARTQLSYCTVTAPFDGHMSGANYDVGAYVAGAGSPVVLATIYADRLMDAAFSIEDNSSAALLRRNLDAGFVDYDSIPLSFGEPLSRPYSGRLVYVSPTVDVSTGTLTLKALIDNPDGELCEGMYVCANLPVEALPKAVLIDDASIGTDQLGKYVYLVNDSDRVVYTSIRTGDLVRDSLRIVTSGVRPGDRYVTKALMKVRDGMQVKPIERSSATSIKH